MSDTTPAILQPTVTPTPMPASASALPPAASPALPPVSNYAVRRDPLMQHCAAASLAGAIIVASGKPHDTEAALAVFRDVLARLYSTPNTVPQ